MKLRAIGADVGPNGCHWMLCIVLYLVPWVLFCRGCRIIIIQGLSAAKTVVIRSIDFLGVRRSYKPVSCGSLSLMATNCFAFVFLQGFTRSILAIKIQSRFFGERQETTQAIQEVESGPSTKPKRNP